MNSFLVGFSYFRTEGDSAAELKGEAGKGTNISWI